MYQKPTKEHKGKTKQKRNIKKKHTNKTKKEEEK